MLFRSSAADLVGSGAITDITPSIASGAFDTGGFEGITGLGEASDPVARAIRAANMANVTGYAPGAFEGITELNAAETADLMKNIDPRMVDTLQPVADTTPFAGYETPDLVPGGYGASAPTDYLSKALALADKYKTPLMYGAGALGIKSLMNADQRRYGLNQQAMQPYSGPLSKFKYDPSTYTPAPTPRPVYYTARYAGGGPIDPSYDRIVGESSTAPQDESFARGGIASLGYYSDGGRMLKGPGDGMSDSIPARIGHKQEARLADGEFVVPADVVSGLGNGSTDAGAKQLYAMLDRIRKARTGRVAQGRQIKPQKYMPA